MREDRSLGRLPDDCSRRERSARGVDCAQRRCGQTRSRLTCRRASPTARPSSSPRTGRVVFLSGDIIAEEGGKWITPFDPKYVDGAAYTMRIGDEAFVSPRSRDDRKPGLIERLTQGQAIVIPPGQFAYLTTREFVTVPHDFLGFINMRSGLKMSGLINVSGFHVDPSYKGKLLFAVLNAGPQSVTVRCDQPAFLIWFARLDSATTAFSRAKDGFRAIDTELMGRLPAENASLTSLKAEIDKLDRRVSYTLGTLTLAGGVAVATIAGIIAGAVIHIWGS